METPTPPAPATPPAEPEVTLDELRAAAHGEIEHAKNISGAALLRGLAQHYLAATKALGVDGLGTSSEKITLPLTAVVRLCDLSLAMREPKDFERVRGTLVRFEALGRVLVDSAKQQDMFVKSLQEAQASNAQLAGLVEQLKAKCAALEAGAAATALTRPAVTR